MKSLKSKLILVIVSLTVVASLVTGAIGLITSINVSNDIIEEQSQTTLQGAAATLDLYLQEQFGTLSLNSSGALVDDRGTPIDGQHEYLDRFADSMSVVATVFAKQGNGFVRVLTNIKDDSGNRAVGTALDTSGEAHQAISSGQSFFGAAQILGDDYEVGYVPLTDSAGQTIGILFVGMPMASIHAIMSAGTAKTISSMLLPAALILAIAIAIAVFVSTSIVRPIKKVAVAAEQIAEGQFNVELDVKSKDEVGQLAESFRRTIDQLVNYQSYIDEISEALHSVSNGDLCVELKLAYEGQFRKLKDYMNALLQNLNATLQRINESSQQVRSGAEQVSDGAQALSQGATEQASSVEELSASISETAAQIKRNAQNALTARDQANAAGAEMNASTEQMTKMLAAMQNISDKSAEISKIIKIIDDIAFQTNILALNAAVEAARAGAAGKGFAVVADEVRNLAGKSADAAKQTSALIEETIQAVDSGSKIAAQTSDSMGKAAAGAAEAVSLIDEIAQASQEQAESIHQINQGVEQISSVVQVNAATAEQSAAASEELTAQAVTMQEQIARFRLQGSVANARPAAAPAPAEQHTPAAPAAAAPRSTGAAPALTGGKY